MIKDARCIAVYGRRGSGKTTLVQRLLVGCDRVVVFDPLGQYAREFRWSGAVSLGALHLQVRAGWERGFRIALTPSGDFAAELHRLSVYLWAVQEPYDLGRDHRKLTLVVEEANLSMPVARLPGDMQGFLRLVLQGRHRGIEIIGVTQRPALVSADFRGNVAETCVFGLGFEDDCRLFRRHAEAVAALPAHSYLRFVDGRVEPGKNPAPHVRRPAQATKSLRT
jgi:hypothetical protein